MDHASLPEVHRVLISTPKSAQYGTLNALLHTSSSIGLKLADCHDECSADGDSRNLLIASSIEECCRIGFGKVPMVSQEVDCFTRYVSYTPKIIPLSKACFYLIKISVLSE